MALTATFSKTPQVWGTKAVVTATLVSTGGTTNATNLKPGLKRIEQVIGNCTATIQPSGNAFDVANVTADATTYLLIVGEY